MMLTILIWTLMLTGLRLAHGIDRPQEEPNAQTVDFIKSRGFLCELHVLNKYGYPLLLYHIINPLADQKTLNKYPVLYGHGVLYDAMSMISRSEHSRPRKPELGRLSINYGSYDGTNDYSMPFMLSNNNFDVWLFDERGTNSDNRNSTVTNTFSPTSDKFWDFSLDDEALVDLPYMIEYVLTKTSSTKLVYVGYSESTFFLFALMSSAPEYADKIAAFIAMAPVAYVANIRGLTLPLLAPITTLTPEFIHKNLIPQPIMDLIDESMRTLCSSRGLSDLLCGSVSDAIGGIGSSQHRPSFFKKFFKSTSIKAFRQFVQLFSSKKFAKYDYGQFENLHRYGQMESPEYDLGKIRSDRIILVRGLADFLSTPQDQARLVRELGTKPYRDIVIPQYNHFDFIDGRDLIGLVNVPALTAVYELMYKDGPNILRDDQQVQAIAEKHGTGAYAATMPSSNDGQRQSYSSQDVDNHSGFNLFNLADTITKSVVLGNNSL